MIKNLGIDTKYKAKLVFKIGEKSVAGVKEEITQVVETEFKTENFVIEKFNVTNDISNFIIATWDIKKMIVILILQMIVWHFCKKKEENHHKNYIRINFMGGDIAGKDHLMDLWYLNTMWITM